MELLKAKRAAFAVACSIGSILGATYLFVESDSLDFLTMAAAVGLVALGLGIPPVASWVFRDPDEG